MRKCCLSLVETISDRVRVRFRFSSGWGLHPGTITGNDIC